MNDYKEMLAQRREVLRKQYARYRDYGSRMTRKNLVRWSNQTHGYYAMYHISTYPPKDRPVIRKLLELQRHLADQAMLILELEHAIDYEEKRLNEASQGGVQPSTE